MATRTDNPVVTDLAQFGYRERKMAAELLTASVNQGFPEGFSDEGVTLAMNMNSGYVFLTNEDYDVAMMNGDKLEMWHNCPYCGHEGFKEDMAHEPKAADCTEYLQQIGVIEATNEDE
jgi:hypothetical protein